MSPLESKNHASQWSLAAWNVCCLTTQQLTSLLHVILDDSSSLVGASLLLMTKTGEVAIPGS